jgi:hypothetical protein
MKRALIYVIVVVVLVVAVVHQALQGRVSSAEALGWVLGPATAATTILLVLDLLFDHWIWRILPTKLVKRPYLHGTWRVTFQTSYSDPETGERRPPAEGYLVVKQTFRTLLVSFLPKRSESRTLACGLESPEDGSHQVVGVYLNTPSLVERDGPSQMHFGGMVLKVCGSPPDELRGHYWTDREPQSKGSMVCDNRRLELFDSFEAARSAFQPVDAPAATEPQTAVT